MNTRELTEKAVQIRSSILESIVRAGKGHIGGALSCTDILTALYYGGILKFDPARPDWPDRDRFILSKGHSCVALFAVLTDLGFIDSKELETCCRSGSRLGGHPDHRIPGVEVDSGSLGHGLGIGVGLALAARLDGRNYRTVVLLGDGECYEGSVWEAAMFAGHQCLSNLTAVIDRNGQCVTDYTEDCNRLEPLAEKWQSFGWEARVINGHDFSEIIHALTARGATSPARPLAVIARTVKGRGVSFMEGRLCWHHGVPNGSDLKTARRELGREGRTAI
ncbi:MAG: transketolase [Pseudomonadota bacterium]